MITHLFNPIKGTQMLRIVVDLTPILPGGENGGAKIMSLQLVKQLAALATDYEFILLATKKNIAELSTIKAPNIRVLCVPNPHITLSNSIAFLTATALWATYHVTKKVLPVSLKLRLAQTFQGLRNNLQAKKLAESIQADLLFCPFTAPFYHNLKIPVVSVVHDIQSLFYPHFFRMVERYQRKTHFYQACQLSQKLICTSEFVKQTVAEKSKVAAENINVIPIRLAHRLPHISHEKVMATLTRYLLSENNFLLYPANFYVHKNHQALFSAFNIYRAKYPDSKLKLICTGADNYRKAFLLKSILRMGLENWIIMPGFLSDEELTALYNGCRALIFPSLYEGFGMPALEAMAHQKPVLCSNLASLPKVAGDAAIYFDPRKSGEIVDAIHCLENQPERIPHLVAIGNEHIAKLGTELDMAKEYLDVFREVAHTRRVALS